LALLLSIRQWYYHPESGQMSIRQLDKREFLTEHPLKMAKKALRDLEPEIVQHFREKVLYFLGVILPSASFKRSYKPSLACGIPACSLASWRLITCLPVNSRFKEAKF
jgi:hypothetical protein